MLCMCVRMYVYETSLPLCAAQNSNSRVLTPRTYPPQHTTHAKLHRWLMRTPECPPCFRGNPGQQKIRLLLCCGVHPAPADGDGVRRWVCTGPMCVCVSVCTRVDPRTRYANAYGYDVGCCAAASDARAVADISANACAPRPARCSLALLRFPARVFQGPSISKPHKRTAKTPVRCRMCEMLKSSLKCVFSIYSGYFVGFCASVFFPAQSIHT